MSFETIVLQKLAQLNNLYNSLVSNSKNIEELPAQTTLDLSSKVAVSRGGVSEHLPLQLLANSLQNSSYNRVVSIDGDITVTSNTVTVPATSVEFNGVIFTKSSSTDLLTPYTSDVDLEREDWIVFNTISSSVVRVAGNETAGIVVPPNLPSDSVFITRFRVTNTTIEAPEEVLIGTSFVKKSFSYPFLFDQSGTDKVIPLDPNGFSEIRLTNSSLTSVSGFDLTLITGNAGAELPYPGKVYIIINLTGNPVTLKHNDGTADILFLAKSGADLVIPNNERLAVVYGGAMEEAFRSWSSGNDNTIYNRKIHWWAVGGNTATSLEQQGALLNYVLQYLGTKQNPSSVVYASNRLSSTPRLVYRSDATAGARAGMFTGRSSIYPFGFIYPFTIVMRFDTSNLASATKSIISAGLYSSSGGVGAVNPSTLLNCILLANDETDTNLHIIHNDNTGTASKIDLGSDFLANQSNQYYELFLDYDGVSVTYKVRRWDNSNMTNTPDAEASGVINTDLPISQAIKWIVERTNYDVAEAVEIAVSNVELYLRY